MPKVTIDIFDPDSIDNAIKAVDALKEKVSLTQALVKKVAEVGNAIAQRGFDSALSVPQYGRDPVIVTLFKTQDGYCISAQGEQVSFIEFGAGVHVNGPAYPGNKPSWVVPWGEYGAKNGRKKEWNTPYGLTSGIFMRSPMYFALKAMEDDLGDYAKRFFTPEEFPLSIFAADDGGFDFGDLA